MRMTAFLSETIFINLDPRVGHHREMLLPSTSHGGSRKLVPERINQYMVAGYRFLKPFVSCALIAFTNLCVISVAATFFVRMPNLRPIRPAFLKKGQE